jgi:hypothetical protein
MNIDIRTNGRVAIAEHTSACTQGSITGVCSNGSTDSGIVIVQSDTSACVHADRTRDTDSGTSADIQSMLPEVCVRSHAGLSRSDISVCVPAGT